MEIAAFAHLLLVPLAVVLFLLPGWLLTRVLGSPFPVLTTVLGSCALLFNSVLILDALHVPLSIGSVGLVLLFYSIVLHIWLRRQQSGVRLQQTTVNFTALHEQQRSLWIWILPASLALISISARAIIDPLSGWDNWTRWDHLARLMMAQGSLAHYPPTTSDDFIFYGWCDGIPPLVPMLNFWLYSAGGAPHRALTAVRVIGEALLIGLACFRLAQHWWGEHAGWASLAVLSTSSLVLWSSANGQETAMLSLSFSCLVLLLEKHREQPNLQTAIWTGVAAGVGSISRDYGLAFILFGAAVLFVRTASWKNILGFVVAAGLVAGPWYARNWIITGNPLFPHALGRWFSSNPIHTEMMRSISAQWSVGSGNFPPRDIPKVLAAISGIATIIGILGAFKGGRRIAIGIAAVGLITGLWWLALPLTAGGWSYAHRVLGPAIVLLAALAGWITTNRKTAQIVIAMALAVVTVDSARRSWLLPLQPLANPWPYSFTPWAESRKELMAMRDSRIWTILVAEAKGEGIIVDHPHPQMQILSLGGRGIPWFSPQIRSLFDQNRSLSDVCAELRSRKVRFITVISGNPMTEHFCRVYPLLHELVTQHPPTVTAHHLQIYDLELLSLAPSDKPSAPR